MLIAKSVLVFLGIFPPLPVYQDEQGSKIYFQTEDQLKKLQQDSGPCIHRIGHNHRI